MSTPKQPTEQKEIRELTQMCEAFEEKWQDKGDERYGLAKHNNTILNRQLDEIADMLSSAHTLGRQSVIEEVRKWAKEEGRKQDKYDGNDLKTAEEYYSISAESWDEIIRLEEGMGTVINDLLTKLDSLSNN